MHDQKTDTNQPQQFELPLECPVDIEIEMLEFSILRDVARLRELKPRHTLVMVMEAVIKYQESEQRQQHPRADL